MMYAALFLVCLILRKAGLSLDERVLSSAAQLLAVYALFIAGVRLRPSVIWRYHRMAVIAAFLALGFYGALTWYAPIALSAQALVLTSYESRVFEGLSSNALIPPRIRQFLSIDGALRSLGIALILGVMLGSDPIAVLGGVVFGALAGVVGKWLMRALKKETLYIPYPLLIWFLADRYLGEGMIPVVVAASILGQIERLHCRTVVHVFYRKYSWFLAAAALCFSLKFSVEIFEVSSFSCLGAALFLVFIPHGIAAMLACFWAGMQWRSYVLTLVAHPPGVIVLSLATALFSPDNAGIVAALAYSFLIQTLLLPPIIRWYGAYFSGRDPLSLFKEHDSVVELHL